MAANGDGALKTIGWKLLPWMADLVCGLLVWWAVQINAQIKEIQAQDLLFREDISALREWRAETSGNRYTAGDHVKYADVQAQHIQAILTRISDLQQTWLVEVAGIKVQLAQMPKKDDLPPPWFREYVKTIEAKLDKHMEKDGKP